MGIWRKKAAMSAIAMSLVLSSLGFSQSEDSYLNKKLQYKNSSPAKADWQLNPDVLPQDLMAMKGQSVSTIDWEEDPDEATDIQRWIVKTQVQVQSPDWLLRLRNAKQTELVGRLLSCSGKCQIVRGSTTVDGQYQSQLLEGDELGVSPDSTAWVFLTDGSLIRLAAQTTVTFQEINFSKEEVLIYLKLLQGYVHYLPRTSDEEEVDFGPQTDAHSLPLMLEKANEAYFAREIFQQQNSWGHLSEYLFFNKHERNHQYNFLNELKKKNNQGPAIKTSLMMAAPNMTVHSQGVSFNMMYLLGQKGYLRKKSKGKLDLSLRGYTRTEPYEVYEDDWLEVSENGRGYDKLSVENKDLEILELLTKRVVSFKMAQEIWYETYTLPILKQLDSAKGLAENFGYQLWESKFSERKLFLEEYVRRLETTHLQSLSNLVSKMKNRGEEIAKNPSNVYYSKALEAYMWSLKNRYNFDQLQIRETNNLQYYVWILKNVKAKKI